ncbi:MAG: hypothetical protein ACJAZ0_001026 [Halioglobus sp.]|jgi:uncharacterized protein YheU (UPF0270 family)
MAEFVNVPWARLDPLVLDALLEEFASRDGTDYGEVEVKLSQRIAQLRSKLSSSKLFLLYDSDSAEWDLVDSDAAQLLLDEQAHND